MQTTARKRPIYLLERPIFRLGDHFYFFTMKSQRQLAAVLNIAAGAVYLLAAIALLLFFGAAGSIAAAQGGHEVVGVAAVITMAICIFLAVLGLPSVIGGWALYVEKSWAKPLLLVLSALHLPNFPIGSALGVYTIWVLLNNEEARVEAPLVTPIS